MIVGSGRGDMVCGFFGEDLCKVRVFRQEGDFGFCFFHSNSKFGCCHELSNEWGIWEEMFTITSEDSVDSVIVQGVLEVLVLHVMVKVVIEPRVVDSVYIYVSVGAEKRFPKEGVMLLGISGMGRVKIL